MVLESECRLLRQPQPNFLIWKFLDCKIFLRIFAGTDDCHYGNRASAVCAGFYLASDQQFLDFNPFPSSVYDDVCNCWSKDLFKKLQKLFIVNSYLQVRQLFSAIPIHFALCLLVQSWAPSTSRFHCFLCIQLSLRKDLFATANLAHAVI